MDELSVIELFRTLTAEQQNMVIDYLKDLAYKQ